MDDLIFFVNSASFIDVTITSSLTAASGSNIDFSLSTQVSGSFVGDLQGTSSYSINSESSSYVNLAQSSISSSYTEFSESSSFSNTSLNSISASHSNTADSTINSSTASYINGLKVKSGVVSGSVFVGIPKKYTVNFSTAFPTSNYSVTVTGQASRTWLAQTLNTGSFVINSNGNQGFGGLVFWQAILIGEFNF
jgi:hypothetical protein